MPCARLSRIRAFLSRTAAIAFILRQTSKIRCSSGLLRGHLCDPLDRLGALNLRGALLQSSLKLDHPSLQLLDAPSLPVQRLEKAVECLPNHVAHLVSPLQVESVCMVAATLCFIRETVYHEFRFVASIKQGLA